MDPKGSASVIPGFPLELYPTEYEGAEAGAAIDSDGDWLVIGARAENDDKGCVYVYHRVVDANGDDSWKPHQTIPAPADSMIVVADRLYDEPKFGCSVGVYGTHMAIGSSHETPGDYDFGCVRFYELIDNVWVFGQRYCDTGSVPNYDGTHMSLHGDTCIFSGYDYVRYSQLSGGVWSDYISLTKPTSYSDLREYSGVALGSRWGAVVSNNELYIYDLDEAEWHYAPTFVYHHGWTKSTHGYCGSVSVDGDTVVISNGHSEAMKMIILRFDGTTWSVEQTMEGASFYQTALMGGTLAVSTVERVTVYDRNEESGVWSDTYSLTPTLNSVYGASLDLSATGLFIGGMMMNHDGFSTTGGAYVYPSAAICVIHDGITFSAAPSALYAPVNTEVSVALTLLTGGGATSRSTMTVTVEWETSEVECALNAAGYHTCPMTFTETTTTEYQVYATCATSQRIDLGTGAVTVYVPEYSAIGTQAHYTALGDQANTLPATVTTDSPLTIAFQVFDARSNHVTNPVESLQFTASVYGPLSPTTPLWFGPASWSVEQGAYMVGTGLSPLRLESVGAHSVVFTDTSDLSSSVTLTFSVGFGVPSLGNCTISLLSGTVGETVTLAVVLKDAAGNDITSGITAHITIGSPDLSSTGVSHTAGVGYQTTLTLGTESGPHMVYAALTGSVPDGTVLSFPFYIVAGPPVILEVTSSAAVVTTAGSELLLITFTLLDASGNIQYPEASPYLYITAEGAGSKILCSPYEGGYEVSMSKGSLATESHGVSVVWGDSGSLTGTVMVGTSLSSTESTIQMTPAVPQTMSEVSVFVALKDTTGIRFASAMSVHASYEGKQTGCEYSHEYRAYQCPMVFASVSTTSYKILVASDAGSTPVEFMSSDVLVTAGDFSARKTQLYYLDNSLDTYPAVATADDPFSLVFKVFDHDGNHISSSPSGVSFNVLVRGDSNVGPDVYTGPLAWSESDAGFVSGMVPISDLGTWGSTFRVSITEAEGSLIEADLSVIPGVPHLGSSTVSSLNGRAGSTTTVTLDLRDSVSNVLTTLTAKMAFDSPDPHASALTHTVGVGYRTTLTLPTTTGPHTLVVSLSGGHLSVPISLEFPFTVASGTPSTLTVLNDFLVEGQDAALTFTVSDEYGNPLTEEQDAILFLSDFGFQSNVPCTWETAENGVFVYSATVSFGSTPMMGAHDVVAVLEDGSYCSGEVTASSLVSSTQSYVEPASLHLTAGSQGGVRVFTVDSAGDPFTSEALVTLHTEGREFGCAHVSDGDGSFYSCSILATDMLTSSFEVRAASVSGGHSMLLKTGMVQVSPGPTTAVGTQAAYTTEGNCVATVPTRVVEGGNFVTHLKVYDDYGNRAETEPNDLDVSVSVHPSGNYDEVLFSGSTVWDPTVWGYVTDPATIHTSGDYTCLFVLSNTGNTSLGGDVALALSVDSVSFSSSETQIFYVENSLDTYPAAATSDDPFSLVFKIFDQFGNRIVTNPSDLSFTVLVRGPTSSQDLWTGPVTWSESDSAYVTGVLSSSSFDTVGLLFRVYLTEADGSWFCTELHLLPGVPHAATSSVSTLEGVAGGTAHFTILLRDASSNILTTPTAKVGFDRTDPEATDSVSYIIDQGYVTTLAIPSLSGPHSLVVTLENGHLSVSVELQFPFNVMAGTPTTLTPFNEFVVSGLPTTVCFSVSDSYGNQDAYEHSAFLYLDSQGHDSSVECDVFGSIVTGDLVYCGDVSFGSTEIVGSHGVSAVLDTGTVCTGTLTVTQVVSATESSVMPSSIHVTAGETTTVQVVVSDPTSSRYSEVLDTTVVCEGVESSCAYLTESSGAFYYCPVSFVDTATTSYEVFVAPLNAVGRGTLLQTGSVAVSAAECSATGTQAEYDSRYGSIALTHPSVTAATEPFSVLLELFDEYSNPMLFEPPGLAVAASIQSRDDNTPLWRGTALWDTTHAAYATDATTMSIPEPGTYDIEFVLESTANSSKGVWSVTLSVIVGPAPIVEEPNEPDGPSLTTIGAIVVGGNVILLLTVLGVAFCCIRRVKIQASLLANPPEQQITMDALLNAMHTMKAPTPMGHFGDVGGMGPEAPLPSYPLPVQTDTESLLSRQDCIRIEELDYIGHALGQGGYAEVSFATWKGTEYAIKLFDRTRGENGNGMCPKEVEDVILEYKQGRDLGSEYIVSTHCLVVSETQVGFLMDYMKGGTLGDAIHSKNRKMSWTLRHSFAFQIASGCHQLYSRDPPVEHRDLKPSNVLLDVMGQNCRLADFGLSKPHNPYKSKTRSRYRGTPAYSAPEMFNQHYKFTEKIDVWSYGVILWEMISGYKPLHDVDELMIAGLVQRGEAFSFKKPYIKKDAPKVLVDLAKVCLQVNPDRRPTFEEIVRRLQ
ncbi:hypothetical protein KIPB_000436 [Kipferlia bialata]|uniref:Protein kinase domain-containing protein n=1 Tax=Kipferlia bialata TaxID=797122 RepID=A0A9K3CND4_9EUKA|nr:hypothetical protein KIPB_000436 [Kipferlia bialata]|eukprot:g436.t1